MLRRKPSGDLIRWAALTKLLLRCGGRSALGSSSNMHFASQEGHAPVERKADPRMRDPHKAAWVVVQAHQPGHKQQTGSRRARPLAQPDNEELGRYG